MASIFKFKETKDTGFSTKANLEGSRLMRQDGRFNVKKVGLSLNQRFSVYYALIDMSWLKLMVLILSGFIIINTLFTCFYYFWVDSSEFSGLTKITPLERFLELFYFSSQTLTTVGYGSISPNGILAGGIASAEALFGLLLFAVTSGLVYARFSKPRARILFSKNAIISPYQDKTALMFRLSNMKESQMIDVECRLTLARLEKKGDDVIRKFYNLSLEIPKINFLPSTWTIVHAIDDKSPFIGQNEKDVIDSQTELLVQIVGHDDLYAQMVNTRMSYKANEIIWDAKFVNIINVNNEGVTEVDLSKISTYESIK